MDEIREVLQCAMTQASSDIRYVYVKGAEIYQIVEGRWYVEVSLQHPQEEGIAKALYRVWHDTPNSLSAIRVAI